MRALNFAVLLCSAACIMAGLGCGPIDEAQEQIQSNTNIDASLEELKAEDVADTASTQGQQAATQQKDVWPDDSKFQNQGQYNTQQQAWSNTNVGTQPQVAQPEPEAVGTGVEPGVNGAVVAEPPPVAGAVVEPAPPVAAAVQPVAPLPYARAGFAPPPIPYNYGLWDVSPYRRPYCGCPPEPVFVPNNPCTAFCTSVRCYDLALFGLNWPYSSLYRSLPYAIY